MQTEAVNLLIVIVNYKTPELTIDALASLASEIERLRQGDVVGKTVNTQVVVVENGSGDDSGSKLSAFLRAEKWDWCALDIQPQNLGFAGGNNLALRPAFQGNGPKPDYAILLNPDTIVHPQAMTELVKFMQEHPRAGIAGSRLEDPDGTPQRSAFGFPSPWTELNDTLRMSILERTIKRSVMAPPVRNEAHRTDWVAGASMIIRKEVFEQVGLLDEGYFVYFEEVDFCLQTARALGGGDGPWECWYVPVSRVVHLVGMASQVNNPKIVLKRRPRYWFDARRRYYHKNYSWLTATLADLAWMSGYACFRLRRWLQRRPTFDPPHFLRDFIRYNYFSRP